LPAAKAGVTTGEWGRTLRAVFGEYRAPTGVGQSARDDAGDLAAVRADVDAVSAKLGRRLKFLVGKPGLDGHSNGAEQIAVRARDCGMEVVYEGIRLTPAPDRQCRHRGGRAHCRLSILSGSHLALVRDVMDRLCARGVDDIPVVVGGIIPPEDAASAEGHGRCGGLYAEGFQAERHHGRYCPDRRGRRGKGGLSPC
jgi:(2R)-ethylmalonyl-CoA mutase